MHRFRRFTALFNDSLDWAGAHLKSSSFLKTTHRTNASPWLSFNGWMEAMYGTVSAVAFKSIVDSKMTYLTHWSRKRMAAISQTTFSNAFSWMEIPIKISLEFIPTGPINNIPALVQTMAWHRRGDKPLFEPMMVRLPTHICVTRPQWVKTCGRNIAYDITSKLCIHVATLSQARYIQNWWVITIISHGIFPVKSNTASDSGLLCCDFKAYHNTLLRENAKLLSHLFTIKSKKTYPMWTVQIDNRAKVYYYYYKYYSFQYLSYI